MLKNSLNKLGRLEPFEIANSGKVLCIGAPSTFIYLDMLSAANQDLIIPFNGSLIFPLLFLIVGIISFVKKKIIAENYGWLVFLSTLAFQHYLTYTTNLNNYSLDFLLVTYVFIFGALFLLNNLFFVLIYSASQLIHLCVNVYYSDLNVVNESAIYLSMASLFVFSFLLMRELFKNRNAVKLVNQNLESKMQKHINDLEDQTKELSTKNEELEEYAYVVSHDLKRPLRNIYTLTDWLTEGEDELNEEVSGNLKLIKEQVSQMDLLVEGVLNYSLQVEKGENDETIDVQKLAERIALVNSGENCEILIEDVLPSIKFNESQLMQVFQNLIQNAIKHNDKSAVKITIGCKPTDLGYQFSIQDNGPGIDPKYHDKIFKLFQKLNVKQGIDSIGIGLALVKKIIERNGGKVSVESTLGNGTTFLFTALK